MPPRHGSRHGSDRRSTHARFFWAIAALLIGLALAGGVVIGRHLGSRTATPHPPSRPPTQAPAGATTPPPPAASPPAASPTAPSQLTADFAQLQATMHAQLGIVATAVGTGNDQLTLGDWQSGPAWSTIKVPLAIAALRDEDPPAVTDEMKKAITESDNAAALSIWASLGDPTTAEHKVEDVLRQTGDPTVVQSQQVRPPYTPFGQTDWSLANQVRFLSAAVCNSQNDPIIALMGQIQPDQSWGIGTIGGTRFKGGWGPSPAGDYLVRQIGVLNTPGGMTAVAIAAVPASGSFDDGTRDLTALSDWLNAHLGALPAGQCDH